MNEELNRQIENRKYSNQTRQSVGIVLLSALFSWICALACCRDPALCAFTFLTAVLTLGWRHRLPWYRDLLSKKGSLVSRSLPVTIVLMVSLTVTLLGSASYFHLAANRTLSMSAWTAVGLASLESVVCKEIAASHLIKMRQRCLLDETGEQFIYEKSLFELAKSLPEGYEKSYNSLIGRLAPSFATQPPLPESSDPHLRTLAKLVTLVSTADDSQARAWAVSELAAACWRMDDGSASKLYQWLSNKSTRIAFHQRDLYDMQLTDEERALWTKWMAPVNSACEEDNLDNFYYWPVLVADVRPLMINKLGVYRPRSTLRNALSESQPQLHSLLQEGELITLLQPKQLDSLQMWQQINRRDTIRFNSIANKLGAHQKRSGSIVLPEAYFDYPDAKTSALTEILSQQRNDCRPPLQSALLRLIPEQIMGSDPESAEVVPAQKVYETNPALPQSIDLSSDRHPDPPERIVSHKVDVPLSFRLAPLELANCQDYDQLLRDPLNKQLRRNLSSILLRRSNSTDPVYESLTIDPENIEALCRLKKSCKTGDFDNAEHHLQLALKFQQEQKVIASLCEFRLHAQMSKLSSAFMKQGIALRQAGLNTAASQVLRRALNSNSHSPDERFERGVCHRELGIIIFARVQSEHPEQAKKRPMRLINASRELICAVSCNPNDAIALTKLKQVSLEAIAISQNAENRMILAWTELQLGNTTRALQIYRKAVRHKWHRQTWAEVEANLTQKGIHL